MKTPDWITEKIAKLVEEHGAVPPCWAMFSNTHPYEIGWRMGAGEEYAMVFSAWWEVQKQNLDEPQRIEYLRKWPPPPRWLQVAMDLLWDLEPWELEDPDDFDYSEYYQKMEILGFGSQEEFERDIDDPKWLES